MKSLFYVACLALPLVGCYGGERRNGGECPAGETCSDLTPTGLDFVGNRLVGEVLLSGPRPTAIGGTQAVALEYDRGDGVDVALDMPFTADDEGGVGVKVDAISGSQVVVRGTASRTNYLRILDSDGLLMDRKQLTAAALDHITLVPDDFENIPSDREIAFATGTQRIGIALWGDVQTSSGPTSERLIDTSIALDLAGATRKAWDTLEVDLIAGTHPLTITAGVMPTLHVDLVSAGSVQMIDTLEPAPLYVTPNVSKQICFEALVDNRYVAGLTWTYRVDGAPAIVKGEGSIARNCIDVTTSKTSGIFMVQAEAGNSGSSLQVTVAPNAAREQAPAARTVSHAITTAGDRAAM